MAALVAAIHVAPPRGADMDARNKSGHDAAGFAIDLGMSAAQQKTDRRKALDETYLS